MGTPLALSGSHYEKVARLWNCKTGAKIREFGDNTSGNVLCVKFSPGWKPREVVGLGMTKFFTVYDTATGNMLQPCLNHSPVNTVVVSADSRP